MSTTSDTKPRPGPPLRSRHDAAYKSFFAEKRAVADTLRALIRDAARHLDLASLERLPASFVTESLDQRHADMLWRVRTTAREWAYLLVLLEFQSTVDRRMALRMVDYWLRIMLALAPDALGPRSEYPVTIPVVIYNGTTPWSAPTDVRELLVRVSDALVGVVPSHRYLLVDVQRLDPAGLSSDNVLAAMVRLEQARSVHQLGEALRALADWAAQAEEPELVARLEAWINILVRPRFGVAGAPLRIGAGIPKGETMTTLLDRIEQWTEEWLEQGREQGLEQGREQGLEQGREQGLEQGRADGRRRVVYRLAAHRFGSDATARLRLFLDRVSNPDRIEAVADAVIECESSEAFIARAKDVAGS